MGRLASGPRRGQSTNDAGFRSTQSIALPDVPDAFDRWGHHHGLARMLHAYFACAERSVGRLVRVRWQANRPGLVLG